MVKDPILSNPSLSFLFEELFFFFLLGNTVSQISPKLTGTTVPWWFGVKTECPKIEKVRLYTVIFSMGQNKSSLKSP